jgi:hypothetical protein
MPLEHLTPIIHEWSYLRERESSKTKLDVAACLAKFAPTLKSLVTDIKPEWSHEKPQGTMTNAIARASAALLPRLETCCFWLVNFGQDEAILADPIEDVIAMAPNHLPNIKSVANIPYRHNPAERLVEKFGDYGDAGKPLPLVLCPSSSSTFAIVAPNDDDYDTISTRNTFLHNLAFEDPIGTRTILSPYIHADTALSVELFDHLSQEMDQAISLSLSWGSRVRDDRLDALAALCELLVDATRKGRMRTFPFKRSSLKRLLQLVLTTDDSSRAEMHCGLIAKLLPLLRRNWDHDAAEPAPVVPHGRRPPPPYWDRDPDDEDWIWFRYEDVDWLSDEYKRELTEQFTTFLRMMTPFSNTTLGSPPTGLHDALMAFNRVIGLVDLNIGLLFIEETAYELIIKEHPAHFEYYKERPKYLLEAIVQEFSASKHIEPSAQQAYNVFNRLKEFAGSNASKFTNYEELKAQLVHFATLEVPNRASNAVPMAVLSGLVRLGADPFKLDNRDNSLLHILANRNLLRVLKKDKLHANAMRELIATCRNCCGLTFLSQNASSIWSWPCDRLEPEERRHAMKYFVPPEDRSKMRDQCSYDFSDCPSSY